MDYYVDKPLIYYFVHEPLLDSLSVLMAYYVNKPLPVRVPGISEDDI